MAINYAEKYSNIIDERFKQGALTDSILNTQYEFDGVNTVNIYSVDTVPLNDYNINAAANRYGTPAELGNDIQTLRLTQDKSFTFTIDRRNRDDTMMANSAGLALNREIDEVVIPTIDKYRISKLVSGAGTILRNMDGISKANAYEKFLNSSIALIDKKVPTTGRVAFVTPYFYKCVKLDKNFVSYADKAYEIAANGVVGYIDNTEIVVTPTDYFPKGVDYIIVYKGSLLSPLKLSEYIEHENPVGISGWVCEGRIYYDAFVPNNKKDGIYVSANSEFESAADNDSDPQEQNENSESPTE